eukprot:SAG25_NODE_11786_length_295_cov_0.790816_1_plen_31_part_01
MHRASYAGGVSHIKTLEGTCMGGNGPRTGRT